jgi:dihydrofolate synthase/folylpolyglutamate synthase
MKILLVTGMLADKQVEDILAHLVEITSDMIITEPDNPRKLKVEELDEKLKAIGISAIKTSNAAECVETAKKIWNDYDAVIFAGSLYLIGDIRRIIRNEQYER